MKLFKSKIFNIMFLSVLTLFYSMIFNITSGHIEFQRILYSGELESVILSKWSKFLYAGNQKFISYVFIILTLIIVGLLLAKGRSNFDEYQYSILSKSLSIMGAFSLIAVPYIVLVYLSIPNGLVESILLVAAIQWTIILLSELYFVAKVVRE